MVTLLNSKILEKALDENNGMQEVLPTLMRDLIIFILNKNYPNGLLKFDLPGIKSTHKHGFDGFLHTSINTEFGLASSKIIIEVGTNEDPSKKMRDDFKKRHEFIKERGTQYLPATFVFITPYSLSTEIKYNLIEDCHRMDINKIWQDIKIFDADKIVEWLQIYPALYLRFCDYTHNSDLKHFETADHFWKEKVEYNKLDEDIIFNCREASSNYYEVLKFTNNEKKILYLIENDLQETNPEATIAFYLAYLKIENIYDDYKNRIIICHTKEAFNFIKEHDVFNVLIIIPTFNPQPSDLNYATRNNNFILMPYKNDDCITIPSFSIKLLANKGIFI